MGLFSNRVGKDELKAGDHIYSWRTAYVYAHHGIYVGNDKVIHFTRRQGQEGETGIVPDVLLTSCMPKRSEVLPCPYCTQQEEGDGVVLSCLDCFLDGGNLYRFEYSVNAAQFLANVRGGSCTLAGSDPGEDVVYRAIYLLNNGFGCYDVLKKNCEDFAIYCKTGLLVADKGVIGGSSQAASVKYGLKSAFFSTLRLAAATTNLYGIAATAVVAYCTSRYSGDIGKRSDVIKVDVEDLTAMLEEDRKMSSTPFESMGGRASWTPTQTTFLLDSLVKQYDLGNTTDNGFKKEVWKKVVDDFNKQFARKINIIEAMNHLSYLKEKFQIVKTIIEQSGFGWDDTLQIPITSKDVWNQDIKAHAKAERFRKTLFPHYDNLRILCGTMAEGKCQKSNGAPIEEFSVEQSLISNASTPTATQTHSPPNAVAPSPVPVEDSDSSSDNIILSTQRDFRNNKHPCVPTSKITKSISRIVASSDHLSVMSTPPSTKDPYKTCLEELQTLEDLDKETMLQAIDYLQQRQNAIAFLTLKGPLRIRWLRNKCGCTKNNDKPGWSTDNNKYGWETNNGYYPVFDE